MLTTVITSSPGFILRAFKHKIKASVPVFVEIQSLDPINFENFQILQHISNVKSVDLINFLHSLII